MNIPIVKILYRNSINITDYITVKNDIDDRHKDSLFNTKTNFEYQEFNLLTYDNKLNHINSSGLNNLTYKIINKISIDENIELIKVSI